MPLLKAESALSLSLVIYLRIRIRLEVFLNATAMKLLEGMSGIESFVSGCAHDTISQKLQALPVH